MEQDVLRNAVGTGPGSQAGCLCREVEGGAFAGPSNAKVASLVVTSNIEAQLYALGRSRGAEDSTEAGSSSLHSDVDPAEGSVGSALDDSASELSFCNPGQTLTARWLAVHGLNSCSAPRKLLGTGATCRVELVEVALPGGGAPLLAARKTIPRHDNVVMRAACDKLFQRELEGLRAGSSCPFFIRRLASAVHEDRLELLLELAAGGTLEDELTDALAVVEGKNQLILPAERIAEVGACVLSALGTLHSQGYAHLDIKPANLLLTSERRVLLGDTGCVSRRDSQGLLHSPAGTPLFMAPELRKKGAAFTTAADLYSVGVLLVVCAAWHRRTGRVLGYLRGTEPLPPYVPEELRDLAGKLTQADPAARPTVGQALAHPFFKGVDVSAFVPCRADLLTPPK